MSWVAQTFGDIELSVTFFIENKEICTQTLQLHKGPVTWALILERLTFPALT